MNDQHKRTWFVCQCGNRITTNHFPLRCARSDCRTVWLDRDTIGVEGWDIVPNANLVNIVCRRFVDDAPLGCEWRVAIMSAVYSTDRDDNMRRLKQKYGRTGDGIPWEYVRDDGSIVVPFVHDGDAQPKPETKRGRRPAGPEPRSLDGADPKQVLGELLTEADTIEHAWTAIRKTFPRDEWGTVRDIICALTDYPTFAAAFKSVGGGER